MLVYAELHKHVEAITCLERIEHLRHKLKEKGDATYQFVSEYRCLYFVFLII
jgi:hypothetical protein